MLNNFYLYFSLVLILNFLIYFFHDKIFKFLVPTDRPDNKRKFHSKPTLISGGLILAINIVLLILILNNLETIEFNQNNTVLNIFLFSVVFFIFGFLDDKLDINAWIKFFLMIIILLVLINFDNNFLIKELRFSFLNNSINLGQYSIFITLLCYLLFINAFNMFDGINLQSSIFSFSLIIFFIYINFLVDINFLILQSLLLFLYLNFKNKSFLGDGGCYLLSFMLGSYSIVSYNNSIINNCDVIFILMILPGFDMLRLFVVRIINKTSPFKPDRNHFHHLLLKNLGYLKTISLISSLIFLNIVLIIFSIDTRIIFLLFIIYYFFLILRFRN